MEPFLRWAGGKRRIAPYLAQYIPLEYESYWEPFLGAGALFFYLAPHKAYLSDTNADLINCYKFVRDKPELISRYLQSHLVGTSEEHYYTIRDEYNKSSSSATQAARFIYLNSTNFNGIFRVNKQGKYNVPYGHKEPPFLPSLETLRSASKLLKKAILSVASYEEVLLGGSVKAGDFVYLDPPYPPINGTSSFTHYTSSRFSWDDQKKVACIANVLRQQQCFVMVSNTDTKRIRNLYKGWHFERVPVTRSIAANGSRHQVVELIITNYPPTVEYQGLVL
jgi:DNA adenine methylase